VQFEFPQKVQLMTDPRPKSQITKYSIRPQGIEGGDLTFYLKTFGSPPANVFFPQEPANPLFSCSPLGSEEDLKQRNQELRTEMSWLIKIGAQH
jgi:hypothetical protein